MTLEHILSLFHSRTDVIHCTVIRRELFARDFVLLTFFTVLVTWVAKIPEINFLFVC